LAETLPRATALLADAQELPRAIYAIGDPTARGLGSLPELAEGAIAVIPISTRGTPGEAAPTPPEHVGIRELSWEPAPDLDPKAVRVSALIHRYGGAGDQLEVGAALEIDGEEVARTRVELDPDGEATAEFSHTLASTGEGVRARVS